MGDEATLKDEVKILRRKTRRLINLHFDFTAITFEPLSFLFLAGREAKL